MGRQNVLKGDADMCAGIEEWLLEIEQHHNCAVRVVLGASTLRRRLFLRAEACDICDDRLVSVRVRRKFAHPTGDAVYLSGAIFSQLALLDRDLTHYGNFMTPNGPLPDKLD